MHSLDAITGEATMNNELLNKAQQNLTTQTEQPQIAGDQQAANIVNGLFKSLFAAKTGWRASFNTKDPAEMEQAINLLKKTWIKAFAENGINTPEQLSCGMKQVRKDPSQFLPSVGQFIEWCKPSPEDYGLPGEHAAWFEVCANSHRILDYKWSHPAVYQAGRQTDWTQIRSMSNKPEVKKAFMKAYEEVCKRVMAGEDISGPTTDETLLEHHSAAPKTRTEENKAAARAALDKLKGIVK